MLESLVRSGIAHISSPWGSFAGCQATEKGLGHFCRGRAYRRYGPKGGFLHFISAFPSLRHVPCNEPRVFSVSCQQCPQGLGLHPACGGAIAFRLAHTCSMCGALLPWWLAASRFCACGVHCYWVSTDGENVCPTCPGHI